MIFFKNRSSVRVLSKVPGSCSSSHRSIVPGPAPNPCGATSASKLDYESRMIHAYILFLLFKRLLKHTRCIYNYITVNKKHDTIQAGLEHMFCYCAALLYCRPSVLTCVCYYWHVIYPAKRSITISIYIKFSTTSIYFSQFFSYLYVCVPLHAKYLKEFLYVSLLFKKLSIKLCWFEYTC